MRVGLIGAGFIGRTHVRVAKEAPGLEVVGYVDPWARADHPDLAGLRAYATLATMLADRMDGVIIAAPDDLHVSMATRCLERGPPFFWKSLRRAAWRNALRFRMLPMFDRAFWSVISDAIIPRRRPSSR